MASEATKLQINFKVGNSLINVYAENGEDLETQLTILSDYAQMIGLTEQALNSGGNVAYATQALTTTVTAAPPTTSVQPVQDVRTVQNPPQQGHCQHGQLVWRESKPGAPKSWKGWFCPSPKGTPDQCEPKFIR